MTRKAARNDDLRGRFLSVFRHCERSEAIHCDNKISQTNKANKTNKTNKTNNLWIAASLRSSQ